jgi:hypothetical protein
MRSEMEKEEDDNDPLPFPAMTLLRADEGKTRCISAHSHLLCGEDDIEGGEGGTHEATSCREQSETGSSLSLLIDETTALPSFHRGDKLNPYMESEELVVEPEEKECDETTKKRGTETFIVRNCKSLGFQSTKKHPGEIRRRLEYLKTLSPMCRSKRWK